MYFSLGYTHIVKSWPPWTLNLLNVECNMAIFCVWNLHYLITQMKTMNQQKIILAPENTSVFEVDHWVVILRFKFQFLSFTVSLFYFFFSLLSLLSPYGLLDNSLQWMCVFACRSVYILFLSSRSSSRLSLGFSLAQRTHRTQGKMQYEKILISRIGIHNTPGATLTLFLSCKN